VSYLLDTNICIYLIKKRPAIVFDKLNNISPGQIRISVITLAELEYGVRKSFDPEKNHTALSQFLIPFEIFEFDYHATLNMVKSVVTLTDKELQSVHFTS
jgi:tRNA(fMet)-specific endonuclease VapC